MGAAILEAQSRNIINRVRQLTDEKSQPENDWEPVKPRKRRQVVVGKNEDVAEVQGVPSHISIHATRLSPSTKPEDLKKMLAKHFPEVLCETHTSKQPNLCASMKVTIRQEHLM